MQLLAAALVKGAKNAEVSRRLISFLASEESTRAIQRTGMRPQETTVKP
jgi:ABC-type thiamine transport system substrate-binding protein